MGKDKPRIIGCPMCSKNLAAHCDSHWCGWAACRSCEIVVRVRDAKVIPLK